MNEQPHYHQAEFEEPLQIEDPNGKAVVRVVKKACPDILEDTIDLVNGELLFTATRCCCLEVEAALEAAGFTLSYALSCEPGDPADLM